MGRRYVQCVQMNVHCLIIGVVVLQEIEKEDDLWQRNNLKSSLEAEKPASEPRQKEEPTQNPEKPAPKTETKRKFNFF